MEQELLTTAVENGIWVILSVALIFYILDDTSKREVKYQNIIKENQEIIKELSKKLNIVNDIQKNVCDIKEGLRYDDTKK